MIKVKVTIRVEDYGDYYQVYWKDDECDNKLGNIYLRDNDMLDAEHILFGIETFRQLKDALAYLLNGRIKPRCKK
jgi:hypothetical protein